jgi:uncharacterized protein
LNNSILTAELILRVVRQYPLPPRGAHGPAHWFRVRRIGLRLAQQTTADPEVVELFALFHDSRRHNEHQDRDHGSRGAALALEFREQGWLTLDEPRMALLQQACLHHTDGSTEAAVTVQVCWDADRLDLGRVGIQPRADKLCTEAAKAPAMIEWANVNSQRWLERYLRNPENRRRYEAHKRECPRHHHHHQR